MKKITLTGLLGLTALLIFPVVISAAHADDFGKRFANKAPAAFSDPAKNQTMAAQAPAATTPPQVAPQDIEPAAGDESNVESSAFSLPLPGNRKDKETEQPSTGAGAAKPLASH